MATNDKSDSDSDYDQDADSVNASIDSLGRTKGFKVLNLNVRSLSKKIDQCKVIFDNSNIDIITLSETWLKTSTPNLAVSLDNYKLVRQDRDLSNTVKKRGGGLVTYIHRKHEDVLQIITSLSASTVNYEALWTQLNMPFCKDILVCNIYRLPNGKLKKMY